MAAAAMPGGTTPPLRPPAPSLNFPCLPALSHRSRTPSPLSTKMDQGDEASGELEQHPVGTEVLESPASSKKKRMKSGDTCMERQVTHDSHLEQRHGSEAPGSLPSSGKRLKKVAITNSQEISRSLTAGSKRPASHESGSIRASKAAKVIDDKVVITQLQNKSKTAERKKSPIMCGSPGINMLARKRAQSHASSPRSPSLRHQSPVAPNSTESPNLHDLSPAAPHGSIRRPRKLTSIIWNDADPIYIGGQLMQGKCKYCKNIFPASKVSWSSQLGRHLKVCEVKCSMDGLMEKIRTSDEVDPNWKFKQESARSHLVRLIVLHGLPFSFVEYSCFITFCQSLNPWFKLVNRVTIQNDCMDAYYQMKDVSQEFFMTLNSRVSLTGDMWTSNQKLGYLCITCHWISSKWRIRHRIIRFCLLETPHDAWNMFTMVLQTLRDWNIEDKVFSFTMDNAEVNTKMIKHLRKNLDDRNLVHYKGRLMHVRCAAHVLNLIVQDGLKAMKTVMDNVRESVKYIRSSQSRKEQFASMVSQEGINCNQQPSLDVQTRWNSTFLMLESTLPFRKAFETLGKQDPNYTSVPSAKEWEMAEDICQLLKAFCHATNIISGSNYPTSNLLFS